MDDRVEVILEKLTTIEEVLEQFLPVLTKMVAHLEGQGAQPHGPVATYRQLYDLPVAGPPEGDLVAQRVGDLVRRTQEPGWWGRIFQEKRP